MCLYQIKDSVGSHEQNMLNIACIRSAVNLMANLDLTVSDAHKADGSSHNTSRLFIRYYNVLIKSLQFSQQASVPKRVRMHEIKYLCIANSVHREQILSTKKPKSRNSSLLGWLTLFVPILRLGSSTAFPLRMIRISASELYFVACLPAF